MVTQAAALAIDFSQSFDRRRHRPSQSALDDPSAGQNFEPFGGVRSLDDLDRPAPAGLQRLAPFRASCVFLDSGFYFILTRDSLFFKGSVYKSYGFMECFYEIRGINDHGLQAVSGMALGD